MCAKLAYSDCNVLRLICQRARPEEPSIDELPPQFDYARAVPAIWKICTFTRARHPGRGRPGQATPRPAWLDMRNAKQHAQFWQSGKHVHQIVARAHYLNVHILSSSSWQICLVNENQRRRDYNIFGLACHGEHRPRSIFVRAGTNRLRRPHGKRNATITTWIRTSAGLPMLAPGGIGLPRPACMQT
jgi:hypothetical protein